MAVTLADSPVLLVMLMVGVSVNSSRAGPFKKKKNTHTVSAAATTVHYSQDKQRKTTKNPQKKQRLKTTPERIETTSK